VLEATFQLMRRSFPEPDRTAVTYKGCSPLAMLIADTCPAWVPESAMRVTLPEASTCQSIRRRFPLFVMTAVTEWLVKLPL
jgi:hypothetical protein